jgi:hypothetical protein
MANKKKKAAQFLQKSWQFHNFLSQNGATFWEIFQKVPLSLLLGTFIFSNMANFPPLKKSL